MPVATYVALAGGACTHASWHDFGFQDESTPPDSRDAAATQSAPYIKDWHLQASVRAYQACSVILSETGFFFFRACMCQGAVPALSGHVCLTPGIWRSFVSRKLTKRQHPCRRTLARRNLRMTGSMRTFSACGNKRRGPCQIETRRAQQPAPRTTARKLQHLRRLPLRFKEARCLENMQTSEPVSPRPVLPRGR